MYADSERLATVESLNFGREIVYTCSSILESVLFLKVQKYSACVSLY